MEVVMADVDSGDVLRLGAGLIYDGLHDIVNVYHILVTAAAGLTWATMTPLIQTYINDLYDHLKVTLHEDIGTGSISVSNPTQLTTLGAIAWSPTWAGQTAGDPTASGVCCFAWGRTYKPRVQLRKYFGVFSEASVAGGFWVAAVQDACEGLMDEHVAEADMGGGTFFQGVAYNRTLQTFEKGVSTDKAAEPAYQRRRKRGRGS